MDTEREEGRDHPVVEAMEPRVVDTDPRERRRTLSFATLFALGALPGAIVFVLAFWIVTLFVSGDYSGWWWASAAIAGAVAGMCVVPYLTLSRADGEDAATVRERVEAEGTGRADAPTEGAQQRDLARRTPVSGRRR